MSAALIALLAVSCATPYPAIPPEQEMKLDVWRITAPVTGTGTLELNGLQGYRTFAPAQLRRAHIYTETGEPQKALAILNAILTGYPRPTPAVESYALYMRARANEKSGHKERAIADCRRASDLAMDEGLRRATRVFLREHHALAEESTPRTVPGVHILDRSGWGARAEQSSNMVPMGRIYRITVHHSANAIHTTNQRECAHAIKLDQRYHMGRRGWGDIGYHFLVDPAGRVWEGRRLQWQGAHAGNGALNKGNVGICLLGNFTTGRAGQRPTPAQVTALTGLLAQLCKAHGIRSNRIYTHQEMPGVDTACPGRRLQTVVDRLRRGNALASALPDPDEVATVPAGSKE